MLRELADIFAYLPNSNTSPIIPVKISWFDGDNETCVYIVDRMVPRCSCEYIYCLS